MPLLNVKFKPESLGKSAELNVILPGKGGGPFPVLYLLHGYSDDATAWQRYTSLERYLWDLPLIVVMPDGGKSFYCNDSRPGGMRYEDFIAGDLIEFTDRTFRTIPRRSARAIAGLSMGGFGAVMLGLRHPDRYAAVSSLSGALGSREQTRERWKESPFLGEKRYDLRTIASAAKKRGRIPALRFDCGRDDFLIEENRGFRSYLEKIRFPHEYREYPGDHTWEYWDAHIRETIAFALKHAGARR